jgi:restriction endonuclease S subunit
MREGWVEATLGDLISHSIGGIWGEDPGNSEVDVPVYRQTEFNDSGILTTPADAHRSITRSQLKSRTLLYGDILIQKSAGTPTLPGRVIMVPDLKNEVATFSNFLNLLRPDETKCVPRFAFLCFWYKHHIGLAYEFQRGTNIKNLDLPSYLEETIFLPPLNQQERIVDLISSVDSYIEALQQQLESAKRSRNALVESQILELSDSSLSSLKNLSTKIGSGATPRGGEEVYIETGVNLIRSQNVYDSNFVMRGLVAIEDSAAKALENVTVEKGDVLINITGASVTRCCVVDSTILPARVNQHVAIIRSDKAKILPKYLVLVLTSNEVKGFLNDIAGTGSTRQALTKSHLEDLEIPVPSISKQTEIIENSDAFDTAISKSQIALDQAKILRSGLLNELLSGEHEIPATYDKVMGAA